MNICAKCGKEFPNRMLVDGIQRDLHTRKYCLDCVPFGERLTQKKKMENGDYGFCKNCNKPLSPSSKFFCSNQCQHEFQYSEYIKKWKSGLVDGLIGEYQLSRYVKRYIKEKFNNKCYECGWNKINPITGCSPLEIHHKDGNYKNNTEDNLVLLCPNCHSLTENYKSLNKEGRKERNH